jgi:NAD-dependent DNA ligase
MLTYAEVDSLLDLADSLNLSRSEVRTIHSTFVSELCEDAISDGFITSGERNEIAELASILDVNGWETILDQQAERRRASGKRAVSVWDPNLGLSPVRAQSAETRRIWAREDSISQSDDLATRLFGKSIVITGEFVEFSREEGRSAILRRGGKAPSSVSRKTFAVVVGESAGPSKIDRCFQFGIPMLNYEEFCSLLDSGQLP